MPLLAAAPHQTEIEYESEELAYTVNVCVNVPPEPTSISSYQSYVLDEYG